MKRLIIYFVISCAFTFSISQDIANDWINPSQTYIKLLVPETGVYRVSQQELLNAGFDLSQVEVDKLHLYFRGEEQFIYVTLDQNDELNFLEFFGEKHDGGDDQSLYREALTGARESRIQTHPAISLFSDTSAYFLTWDQQASLYRYTNYLNTAYQNFSSVTHFRYESRLDFDPESSGSVYSEGVGGEYEPFFSLSSNYGLGEGFVGPGFSFSNQHTLSLPSFFSTNSPNVELSFRILGQSQSPHHLRAVLNGETNNPILDTIHNTSKGYIQTYKRNANLSQPLPPSTQVEFSALRANTDNNHVVFASIIYDRLPILSGQASIRISQWTDTTAAYFRFAQDDGNDSVYVYDLENGIRNIGIIDNGIAKVVVNGTPGSKDLYVSTDNGIRSAEIIAPRLNNLSEEAGAELLIITNRKLASSAQAYANYRDTNQVNSLSAQVVFTDEIYDEFGYGSPTPLAIQRFCNFALNNWATFPEYVLLWGKAKDQIRGDSDNLLPTYGYPASDHYFITPLQAAARSELIPKIPIGRLNIKSDQEGMNYLNKVRSYEHSQDNSFLNQGVFLGGGASLGEQNAIKSALEFVQNTFDTSSPLKQSYLCLHAIRPTDTLCDQSIDTGVGLIHFFGHATANVQDIALMEAFEYNNFGKFPLMIGMTSITGGFTQESSFSERWVLEENRGAIAYVGNSSFAYLNPLRDIGKVLYPNLYKAQDQRLGDAIHESLVLLIDSLQGVQYVNHALQFNLQGDPTLLWRGGQTLTSNEPLSPDIQLKIFPNPSKGPFEIQYELPKRGELTLNIVDMQGKIVFKHGEKKAAGIHQFEWNRTRDLSPGIYLVQLRFEDFLYNYKLLIQD